MRCREREIQKSRSRLRERERERERESAIEKGVRAVEKRAQTRTVIEGAFANRARERSRREGGRDHEENEEVITKRVR